MMTSNTSSKSSTQFNTSQTGDEFSSFLFNLLPSTAQKGLNRLAQIEHRMQSHEPLLRSHENKVTVSLIDTQLLRTHHLSEHLDQIGEELKQIQHDLFLLKSVDLQKLEDALNKLSSQNRLHQVKVLDYGDEKMPILPSLKSLEAKNFELEVLRKKATELRQKGKLYEGVINFHIECIRRMIHKVEQELNTITEKIATHVDARRSLGRTPNKQPTER